MESNAVLEGVKEGLRFNEGKIRMDLIPPEMDRAYAEIATMGAKKYAPRNWELGMEWMKMIASLKRHLNEWELGNDTDPESGYNHMKHVLWNAGSLVAYIERGIGTDDRPVTNRS